MKGVLMRKQKTTNWRDRNHDLQVEWNELMTQKLAAEKRKNTKSLEKIRVLMDRNDEEFIELNKGLVVDLARRFFSPGDDNSDDYVQDAVLGALEARRKWDVTRNVTFATFSRQYIAGRVKRGVRVLEYNQLSNTDFAARKHVLDKTREMQVELGRVPSDAELSKATGFTLALVNRVRMARATSLDLPIGEKGETLGDVVLADKVEDIEVSLDDIEVLKKATKDLSAQELFVLSRRIGLDGAWAQSTNEVASLSGLGRGTVSRRDTEARRKIKERV
jgi:RNA polymerase sigma factor (sigma-70 family)